MRLGTCRTTRGPAPTARLLLAAWVCSGVGRCLWLVGSVACGGLSRGAGVGVLGGLWWCSSGGARGGAGRGCRWRWAGSWLCFGLLSPSRRGAFPWLRVAVVRAWPCRLGGAPVRAAAAVVGAAAGALPLGAFAGGCLPGRLLAGVVLLRVFFSLFGLVGVRAPLFLRGLLFVRLVSVCCPASCFPPQAEFSFLKLDSCLAWTSKRYLYRTRQRHDPSGVS